MLNEIISSFANFPYREWFLTLPAYLAFKLLGGFEFYQLTRFDPFQSTDDKDRQAEFNKPSDQPPACGHVNNGATTRSATRPQPQVNYRTLWPEQGFYTHLHAAAAAMRLAAGAKGVDEADSLLQMELQRLQEAGLIGDFMSSLLWNDSRANYESIFTVLLPDAKVVLAKAEALAGKLYCNQQAKWRQELSDGSVCQFDNLEKALSLPRNQAREILQRMNMQHARVKTLLVFTHPQSQLNIALGEQAPSIDIIYLDNLQQYLTPKTAGDDYAIIRDSLKRYEQAYQPRNQTGEFA